MSTTIALFSRDNRSFRLFRKSWIKAFTEAKISYSVINRGFGFFRSVIALVNFIGKCRSRRIIFGASEICLYSAFSTKHDIWVFTGIGRLLQYSGNLEKVLTIFLRWTYRQQKIVALNPQDVAYLESVLPTKVILINGEGFDFNNVSFFEKKNSSSIVIAYAGRLLKSKGVDKLVEAFIQLSDFNCELRLIGDFDFSNSDAVSAEWLAEMQSISNNRIHCYGFVNNAREMLKEVDIYISLSDREGLPFSVLEAIEAGCLIVLSSVPGHLSFVDLNGILLVEKKNLKLLLEDILNNPIEYFNFDVFERLKISNARFGMKNIISEIKSKIL